MEKFRKIITSTSDAFVDALEKTSSPASRAGSTAERVGKMKQAEVDNEVIALQLSKRSSNGNNYTAAHVEGIAMLYFDSRTRVGITAAQATALIRDQREQTDKSGADISLEF